MDIHFDEASLLALFLETLFYGTSPISEGCSALDFIITNRHIPYFVLVNAIYPTHENWHSTTSLYPSDNLAALHRKCGERRQPLLEDITQQDHLQHLVISFVRALEAFVFDIQTISPDTYYDNFSSSLDLAKMALYVLQTTLADVVIVSASLLDVSFPSE
jgi:hypothetical protein